MNPRCRPDLLLPRLAENEVVLLQAYELVNAAVEANLRIASASEWLLDNFHLIEEQIRTARRHLPRGYSKELPCLSNGPSTGQPRVYDIALELISHVDGRVDEETVSSFVAAYEAVTPLKLGELWAIPIMLRLALIENLRRVAARMASGRIDRNDANRWADRITEAVEKDPKNLILVMADLARSGRPFSSAFVAELARRLQGQGSALALPLTWIEQRLAEDGVTTDQLVQSESQQRAANQVSIGNSIGSLRFLGAMDWREFVEKMSSVERVLREDPAGVYAGMDFATRDRYRHVVEAVAKENALSEIDVARKVVDLAREGIGAAGVEEREAHIGFYLIDDGLARLEKRTGRRPSIRMAAAKIGRRFPLFFYLGAIVLLTAGVAAAVLAGAHFLGARGWALALAGILPAFCATQLAVTLVNWVSTALVRPHTLPRMDFSEGVPVDCRTLVTVPTMLTSTQAIEDLLEGLEVRYLANRGTSVHFSLLTDFKDALEETTPEDEQLLRLAREGIEALNDKYGDERTDAFFLFHRPRRWNQEEQTWMGYERKREKIAELNALLRGVAKDRFSLVLGETSILESIKYVITLDTDTRLPRDSARRLVETIAHPLNRPRLDRARRCVSAGYAILQPRVAMSLPGASGSLFARLFAGDAGIDPYTRMVSDVYQDVFREGSFIGKGIYDVDAFRCVLDGRLPENRILSHDLLESCHARSALVSDVELYEEHPSSYNADVSRRHRWIRGDWQIAAWLLPRVPDFGARRVKNPISALSRWKIADNLRRSLIPFTLTLLLVLGWLVLEPAWFWTLVVGGIILGPSVLLSIVEALKKPADLPVGLHLRAASRSMCRHLSQAAFTLVFLPHEAFFSVDAIVRSTVRMLITHRRLLEWTPAIDSDRNARTDLAGFYRSMWISPPLAILVSACLALWRPEAQYAAGPFLGLWLLSPAIAWWISRPVRPSPPKLTAGQKSFLSKLARKSWRFFETFVGPEDHWLPPDNFQEHPAPVVAHRTSPTNMGLSLLASLAAWDFGYIPTGELLERTQNALQTMEGLERYRKHFYNWYDTRSLQPLLPLYVSTVDSGNLAGHLLTFRMGLLELPGLKVLRSEATQGLTDTLRILRDALSRGEGRGGRRGEFSLPSEMLARIEDELKSPPRTLAEGGMFFHRLAALSAEVSTSLAAHNDAEPVWWAGAFERQCRKHLDELVGLAPWVSLPPLTVPPLTVPPLTVPLPAVPLPAVPPSIVQPKTRGSSDLENEIDEVHAVLRRLVGLPTLRDVARLEGDIAPLIDRILERHEAPSLGGARDLIDGLIELRRLVADASRRAAERIAACEALAMRCGELADVEYDFLYDKSRQLLAIGYNASERRRDASFYDLLASEARLSSFVAIAQGRLPQEHWFALGRLLTSVNGENVLLSWGSSMFEYLMPLLVMPTYESTLLDQTSRAVIQRQIEYGVDRGVPWGISESCYNVTDAHLNYQYRAFGVPGLGLKRGLADDLVIAPYATAMALMVAPEEACANLERMAAEGFEGRYGFFEAIDYTPSRLARDQKSAVIRSFMAHHQGMTFLSLTHLLLERPMQRRFASDPLFQATDLLLQERIPKVAPSYSHATEASGSRRGPEEREVLLRVFTSPNTATPEVHLLSNGRYHVMVTSAGGGYSRWKDIALTRWREDATRDDWGSFCYIRDVASGEVWSTAHQPTLKSAKKYEAIFTQSRAEFRRLDHEIDTYTEVAVSPEDDIEVRRTTITNRSRERRLLDFTSYAEVVFQSAAADAAHPAFGNLFIETEIIEPCRAILCSRRPRSEKDARRWMVHLMAVHGQEVGQASFETERWKFIGRGRTAADPEAMTRSSPLSGSQGPALDPIVAIRRRVRIDPEEVARVDLITGIAETREAALALVEKYHDRNLADRVFDLAWTHRHVVLRQLNATEADAQVYGRLASSVIYASSSRRASPGILAKNRRGQSGLWGYGISGDLPIVLLRIGDAAKLDFVRQLVQAHEYWRVNGLAVDLVIWNEDSSGYRQLLQDQILGLVTARAADNLLERSGGIFVRRADQIPDEDKILLQAAARAIVTDSAGTLEEEIERRGRPEITVPRLLPLKGPVPTKGRRVEPALANEPHRPDLVFFNGIGGFTPDGREYVIRTDPGCVTPAPWVNVIANPRFGTVLSESGGAYTWSENAHELRLTPWYNDPVTDASGEALYIRDEESGRFWSPCPLPARGSLPYVSRHGFGYSVFEYAEGGIKSELWVYVSPEASVKFTVLKLRNESGRPRRLSVTCFLEWVLGELRSRSHMHVVTEVDPRTGALLARNPYHTEFVDQIAFLDVSETARSITGDRAEFLGRNGTIRSPAAMSRMRLSGKVGAGLDPCGAMQVQIELAPSQEREVVFLLGAGRGLDEARALVQRFRGSSAARRALEETWAYWNRVLGTVHMETPDRGVDILANGWLLYQTLACRMWARTGHYQSGGAFGFRDQLQDSMAILHAEPRLLREHLLRSAAHQFREGDVQHWWHPPSGRGVRTHCSDDYLWLPLVTCRYVTATGDTGVLDEKVHFIEGRPVKPEEEAYYDLPVRSEEAGTLYDHCVRAITRSLKFGRNGLPLMGSGDWNDGMNLVGAGGAGESVWLAFFLHEVLLQFSQVAEKRGHADFAKRCAAEAARLSQSIEQNAWDGEWYLRAFFDNGEPLGSSKSLECRIDSIPQSWAVLSGAGDPQRSRSAMDAVDRYLVRRKESLIQLFDPPFDKSALNPGYIKGYVPGVRENGGQYTHAAVWAVMAFAKLGDSRRAWEFLSMILPTALASTPRRMAVYKVEPYVVAADVYAAGQHSGRGGWTWYTGSASWMYQLIVESLLGLRLDVDKLRFTPCLPAEWKTWKLHYRYRETMYHVTFLRKGGSAGVTRVVVDGIEQAENAISLVDDRREHKVDVEVG